jgi:hypothetical protein
MVAVTEAGFAVLGMGGNAALRHRAKAGEVTVVVGLHAEEMETCAAPRHLAEAEVAAERPRHFKTHRLPRATTSSAPRVVCLTVPRAADMGLSAGFLMTLECAARFSAVSLRHAVSRKY